MRRKEVDRDRLGLRLTSAPAAILSLCAPKPLDSLPCPFRSSGEDHTENKKRQDIDTVSPHYVLVPLRGFVKQYRASNVFLLFIFPWSGLDRVHT